MTSFQNIRTKRKNCIGLSIWVLIICLFSSCEDFFDVELPSNLVSQEKVFSDDVTATSAVKGMYVTLLQEIGFSSGSIFSAAALTGLAADELNNFANKSEFLGFEENNIPSENIYVSSLWSSIYKSIYDANSIIEGLDGSTKISSSVKDQLKGEALFVRAYCYFYLVNLFGDVPLITTTNYKENNYALRVDSQKVYNFILNDLQTARTLLQEDYQYKGVPIRIRPNKSTATALLARVNLYLGDWQGAEAMSTIIIQNTQTYRLEENLNSVFFLSSKEVIWQLLLPESASQFYTTYEGFYFIILTASDLNNNVLSDALVNSFELNDQRKINWIGNYNLDNTQIYFPKKYKVKYGSNPISESSTLFRVAEQYLIRAEARANNGNLQGAVADLDAIRKRAGLPLFQSINPTIPQNELIQAIQHERQTELFTEGCHRWFDLKRTNSADNVLDPLKSEWSTNDQLFPIPAKEFERNPNLKHQNPGY